MKESQHAEGMTEWQEREANEVLRLLDTCYPNHPWSVRVSGGCIFIRHLQFGSNWGMNIKVKDVQHDAAVQKRTIVRLAGEWLERAGLKRGTYDEEQPDYRVEGVPEKFQPVRVENGLA